MSLELHNCPFCGSQDPGVSHLALLGYNRNEARTAELEAENAHLRMRPIENSRRAEEAEAEVKRLHAALAADRNSWAEDRLEIERLRDKLAEALKMERVEFDEVEASRPSLHSEPSFTQPSKYEAHPGGSSPRSEP